MLVLSLNVRSCFLSLLRKLYLLRSTSKYMSIVSIDMYFFYILRFSFGEGNERRV
jgi:hypothetical protein